MMRLWMLTVLMAICLTSVLSETSTTPKKRMRSKVIITETSTKSTKYRTKVEIPPTSTTPANKRSKKPTRKRQQSKNQIVVPPVSCPDLYDETIDIGDEGPQIRKTQHNTECRKYFECVINRWIIRDCPEGTTFNGEDKNCDSSKSCKPSQVEDLYREGIESLKSFLGINEREEI